MRTPADGHPARPSTSPRSSQQRHRSTPVDEGPDSVEVTVQRDDTLDRSSVRSASTSPRSASCARVPEVRKALDVLRPGDIITLTHVDGVLQSLNRQISNTLTLSVARAGDGYAINYIENPLETTIVGAARAHRVLAVRGRPEGRHVVADDHDAREPDLRLGHRLRARHPRGRRVQRALRAEAAGRPLRVGRPRARRRVREPGQDASRGVVRVEGRRGPGLLHARGQGHAQGVPARAARLHAHQLACSTRAACTR